MTRQELEAEGFDVIDTPQGVIVKARHWVEDWGPFDTDAEAITAVCAAVPALSEPESRNP